MCPFFAPHRLRESEGASMGVCVTGQISDYHGKPEIVLTDPSQVSQ